MTNTQSIQRLYVAYFNRPADVAGLQYWVAQLNQITGEGGQATQAQLTEFATKWFSPSQEYIDTYAEMTNEQVVDALYMNLFGRHAEDAGRISWANALTTGEYSFAELALQLTYSAQGTDALAIANKLVVSAAFTGALDTPGEIAGYSGDAANDVARAWLKEVTDDSDSIADALASVNHAVANAVAAGLDNPGGLFTLKELTIGVDDVVTDVEPVITTEVYWGCNECAEEGVNSGVPLEVLVGQIESFLGYQRGILDMLEISEDMLVEIANITIEGVKDETQGGDGEPQSESGDVEVDEEGTLDGKEGDYTGNYEITVTLSDGSTTTAQVALSAQQFEFINGLLFDENGNTRLYEVQVKTWPQVILRDANGAPVLDADGNPIRVDLKQVVTEMDDINVPIILTPTMNNGGTEEPGMSTDLNDTIVAARLSLLHGAYIDGGGGENTLEIDAKGYFAQPKQLLNIQNIVIENLPNIYTDNTDGSNDYPYLEGTDTTNAFTNSVIDITRAVDLDHLVITEGSFTGLEADQVPGTLTVAGVRANAVTTFEGSFTRDVNVYYSEGMSVGDDGIHLVFRLGETTGAALNIFHNSATVNIDSQGGGNAVDASFGASSLMNMNIFGDAKLQISGNLADNFQPGHPATIDASANTAGVDLTVNEFDDEVVFTGTAADDHFNANNNGKLVLVSTGTGNDEISANDGQVVTINAGEGNNEISANNGGEEVTIVAGNGDNEITADNGQETVSITVGNGDNKISSEESYNVVVVAGDGANYITVDGTESAVITAGDGGNDITAVNTESVSITTGDGADVMVVSAEEIAITSAGGDDVVTVAGAAGGTSEVVSGDLNLMLILDDSGSMAGSDLANLKTAANAMLDQIEAGGVDAAAITIYFGSAATPSAWGSFDQARAIINGLDAGSGGTDYVAALDAAKTAFETSGAIAGATNLSVFISDGESVAILTSAQQANWETFLQDKDIISYAVGIGGLTDPQPLAPIAYNGSTSSDIEPILGTSADLTDILSEIAENTVGGGGTNALVTIDLGTGENTLILGDDDELAQGLIALEGSSITGQNIKLVVNADSDLQAATLFGITSVVLDNADIGSSTRDVDNGMLTLTAAQFKAIGADNFSVEGSVFHTYGQVKIIVTDDISLTELGADSLSRNIDLLLEVQDGVTLTMTAEQLHTKVAPQGITLANDGNTDYGVGNVIITDGGLDFDPFNTSDTVRTNIDGRVYIGGSLSNDFQFDGPDAGSDIGPNDPWYNVSLKSVVNGYDRPADVPVEVVITLDSGTGIGTIEQGAFSTWHTNLEIVGEKDIDFNGAVQMGMLLGVPTNHFTVDFSQLEAKVIDFTLDNFELLGQGGGIYGNADNGYDSVVHVQLAADVSDDGVGFDEADAQSLVSSGVSKYVVTVIDGPTAAGSAGNQATIRLCDTTQDLEVMALRGNWNDTLNVVDAAWGLAFELQGGTTLKADGPTGTANVGQLVANYEWDGASAVVNIVHSVAGDIRPLHVAGIEINNADTLSVNAAGSVVIESIAGASETAGESGIESLDLNTTGNMTIVSNLPEDIESIDAAGVIGHLSVIIEEPVVDGVTFVGAQGSTTLELHDIGAGEIASIGGVGDITLVIGDSDGGWAADDVVDLTETGLTNVETVVLTQGSALSITMADADVIGAADFVLADGATAATLNLSGLDGEPFALANYAEGIIVDLVTIADLPVVTLHIDTDLTGIARLEVPEGTVLNMTAEQYQQLNGAGVIVGIDATTDFTVNITGLAQADVEAGFDLSGITAENITVTLAGDVNISAPDVSAPDADTIASDFNGADITLASFTLTLYDVMLSDGLNITGGTGSTLEFTDVTGLLVHSDASGFNFDFLRLPNLLVSGNNVDYMFEGLAARIEKVIYNGIGDVEGRLQNVTIEAGTTIFGDLSFNNYQLDVEVSYLTLNMEGGVQLEGDLVLSTVNVNVNGPIVELVPYYLQGLTINSTGTGANLINGETANVISGDITPAAYGPAIGIGSRDNNLKSVTIEADQKLIIEGEILFSSHGDDDSGALDNTPDDVITANDDNEAVAQLTINGTADVEIGYVNTTDDDIDGLNVVNNGTGTVSLTVDATKIDQDSAGDNVDALSFTGSNIELTVAGAVNLSDDVLSGVSKLTIGEGAALTLSLAQFNALGAVNLLNGDTDGVEDEVLHLVGVDGAFDATTVADGIDVKTLTLSGDMDFSATGSDLTDVDEIIVPEGATLTLTAAQYQQLLSFGTITGVDEAGNATAEYTVAITNLTQADIDGGAFVTTGITADTITVALGEDVNLSGDDVIENVGTVIMTDGQTLGLANEDQADELNVNGGTDTTIIYQFLPHTTYPGQIDASGYSVTTLKALAAGFTMGGNSNVEYSIDDLPSSVILRLYQDPAELGFLDSTYRVVVIEEGITTPTGLIFNDWDVTDEVRTLNLTLEGDVTLNGNLSIPTRTDKDGAYGQQQYFNLLTINSEGVDPNTIDGDINTVTVLGTPNTSENNLLNVVINAEQALLVDGDIVFNSINVPEDDAVATLTVNGTANVTIQQLNVLDDDIDALNVTNNSTGILTVTGGSPALDGDASIETLTLTGTGNIVFGSNPDVAIEWGVSAAGLSTINAAGLSGNLDMGEIRDIDSADFSFIAGTGITTMKLTTDSLNADTDGPDNIVGNADDQPGWSFDFSDAADGSVFELGNVTWTEGELDIDLGAKTTLYISADTDLRAIDLSITQTLDIVLAAGVELKVTAKQAHLLNIVADAGIIFNPADPGYVAADVPVVNIFGLADNVDYDFSGISADIAGTIHLADDDVTVGETANLAAFSVTLVALNAANTDLSGQTIRFQTEIQAGREIDVDVSDITDGDNTNSTNVVWLFDSVSEPVDTSNYDANVGRVWFTPELVNGANVEQLFNTLPDSILRVEFSSIEELDILLTSADVDRIVELVSFTNLPAGLVFSDEDRLEHVRSLTINMGGEVNLGNLTIDNIVDPTAGVAVDAIDFTTLTLSSVRALSGDNYLAPEAFNNDNDGTDEAGEHVQPKNLNTVGNIGVGAGAPGLDLLNVTINTGAVSVVGNSSAGEGADIKIGTITFDAEEGNTAPAKVTVTGANKTTIASLDTADPDISAMEITNSGTGALAITGASPAAAVSNTERLTISATGSVTLGTAGAADKPGIAGSDLSAVTVTGPGIVNLGVIAQIDSTDDTLNAAFTLDGSGKATTVGILGSASVGGVATAPALSAGSTWNFKDATLTLTEDVLLGAGNVNFDNVALTISGDVDFTTLAELTLDATDVTIEVPEGSSLTILAEDADGLTITGDGLVTITELENTPDADLSKVMTTDGDTGIVEVLVTTDDAADVNFTGKMGKAHVTVSGDGIFDVTAAAELNSIAFDHDADTATPEESRMSSYTVEAAATMVITAAQADERDVDGTGTTDVEDIGLFAGTNDMSLARIVTTKVNIAVDSDVTLDSDDDLGEAGAGRVTTIADGIKLTSAGSVVHGQYIDGPVAEAGINKIATLCVDDENDATAPAIDSPITADLRHVTVEFIELVDDAVAGMITFPILYGDPAAKDLDPTVAVQTVTMTAKQASGQTINGANAGDEGEVIVKDLDGGYTDLMNIDAGRMTAHVEDTPVELHAATDLGSFDVELDATAARFTLSAAQADGIKITDGNPTLDATVTVTALEGVPNADLSRIEVFEEIAELDADGGLTLRANLGGNMEVIVSDSVAGGTNTVTFSGTMVSADTTFTIASDDITLVFDANDAHELTVAEAAGGVAKSAVIVNNVDGDEMDLTGITADTLTANVPADATMDVNTNFGGFNVVLADGVDVTMSFTQMLQVGLVDNALEAGDFAGTVGAPEETVTVTDYMPAVPINTSVLLPDVAMILHVQDTNTEVTVAPGTDFTGVEEIVIPEGVILTMTADQYQQIQTSVTVSGLGTLNLTGFDGDNANINLSNVTAHAGTISLDPDAGETQVVAGQVEWVDVAKKIVLDPAAVLDNAAGEKFSIIMTDDKQGITLSSETQADGRSVSEAGSGKVDTRLILGFDTPDAVDPDVNLVATNYAVDHVYVLNTYLDNQFGGATPANIETFLFDLNETVAVVLYDADKALAEGLVSPTAVESVNRVITIEPNTFVDASIAFNDLRDGAEVVTLTLNMGGNSVIDGSLTIPQNEDPQDQLPTNYVNLFDSVIGRAGLIINSTDETGAPLVSPNVIDGNIIANTALHGDESEVEIFTLTLDAAVSIVGNQDQIGFDGKVITLDDGDGVDDVGAALAAVTYQNWSASYNPATREVTFTNRTAGDVTNVTLDDFEFLSNDPGTTDFPGVSAVATVQEGVFQANENNLLHVEINADHDLNITGTLEFSYVSGSDSIDPADNDLTAEAYLTINVGSAATVNIGSVDTSDTHITALHYTKTGIGTVHAPGTSPGAAVGNTETLNINQVNGGLTTFGTAGDLDKPGVAGADLSLIEVIGEGSVDLGVIAQVDADDFTLDTTDQNGTVSAVLRADQTGGTWTFDNSSSLGALNLTIAGTGTSDAYGTDAIYGCTFNGGTMELQNVTLVIEGTVDFTSLTALVLGPGTTVEVSSGATLIMDVQMAEALGVDITGDGAIQIVGEFLDTTSSTDFGKHLKTVSLDLSGVTLGGTATAMSIVLEGAIDGDGNAAGQQVTGSGKDDVITTTNTKNDTITGGEGNDSITAGDGDDQVFGEAGDDTIAGADNNGIVDGGADTDTLILSAAYAPADDDNLEGVENVALNADGLIVDLSNQAGEAFNVTVSGNGSKVTTADGKDVVTGGSGIDLINTGDGDDFIAGGGGADSLVGGLGEDTISGDSTDQLIDGDDGTVAGGSIADLLIVGDSFNDTGDDQIVNIEIVNAEPVTPGSGSNINLLSQTEGFAINGSAEADTIVSGSGKDTLDGGAGDDSLSSDGGEDVIYGKEGNDTIRGGAVSDSLYGGEGDDTFIFANAAALALDATVDGGDGTDTIQLNGTVLIDTDFDGVTDVEHLDFAGDGVHSITMGASTNAAYADGMTITVSGDAGAATLTVDGALSTVAIDATGTGQGDTLTGGSAADKLMGGDGNDTITGGAGVDSLIGGEGDDTIIAGDEDALIDGGDDTVDGSAADVLEVGVTFNDGSDDQIKNIETVNMTVDTGSSLNLADQTEGFTINGTDDDGDSLTAANGQDTIVGSQGNDSIASGSGNDSIIGGAGDDTVDAGEGDDIINGGTGNNEMTGGKGVDTFVFTADAVAQTDTITDWGNDEGGDVIDGQLGAGDRLNVIFGSLTGALNQGNPTIGAIGTSPIVVFADSYDVGDVITITIQGDGVPDFVVSRTVKAGHTSGYDVARDFEGVLDSLNLHATDPDMVNGTLLDASTATVYGVNGAGQLAILNDNGGDGSITVASAVIKEANGIMFDALGDGTSGVAALHGVVSVQGSAGDDTITGGIGSDTIHGLGGSDFIDGAAGNDSIEGDANADTILGGVGNDTIFGNGGADSINGGDGADSITGGNGADTIDGGNGADTIDGGKGSDSIDCGNGGSDANVDTITFDPSQAGDSDTVFNFESIFFEADVVNDIIDVSAMGFASGDINYTVVALAESAIMTNAIESLQGAAPGTNNILYMDINQNGVFNAADDMVVELVGTYDILWSAQIIW